MIFRLFRLELLAMRSDGRSSALLALALVMLMLSAWIGAAAQSAAAHGRAEATASSRQQWEAIEGLTAHAAAHFGSYVYKPGGALAALDSGVLPFTGKVVRVEGHVQNPPAYSDASAWSSLVRLGAFDASAILAQVLSLLLAFTAFSSLTRDRETGLLRALVAQGVSMRAILWGKALAYWSVALALVIALTGMHLVIHLATHGWIPPDMVARLVGFGGVHAAHLLVVVLLTVSVSASARDSRAALALLTIAWLAATVIMPRITAELGAQLFPLSSQVVFEDDMKEDRSKGLDGHNPADKRRLAVQQQILEEHGVASPQQLPVNISGLLMQADEEYGNKVWDEHFGRRHATVWQQILVVQVASFFNPYQAARGLSMAFAGTDQFHDTDFQRQAEEYRRALVATLNDLDATAGRRGRGGRWQRDRVDYADIADFQFKEQPITFALAHRWIQLVALFAWVLAAGFLLRRASRRVSVVATR